MYFLPKLYGTSERQKLKRMRRGLWLYCRGISFPSEMLACAFSGDLLYIRRGRWFRICGSSADLSARNTADGGSC